MKKIFIDGNQGTTGLKIFDRLSARKDIELIILPDEKRKEPKYIKQALCDADIAFLCLPDEAAKEAAALAENTDTVIIDTSTAHRTSEGWIYGFPELDEKISSSLEKADRIAVPGCHASGFIALVYPLIKNGFISKQTGLCCHSLTGYSGGGKKMIKEYEADEKSDFLFSPREYGLNQNHKHLNEMVKITGIETAPVFCPIVDDFFSGMLVTVPIFKKDLLGGKTAEDIKSLYRETYRTPIVSFAENADENGFFAANAFSGKDSMQITVRGNNERILLVARYDNLGKGASGAAIECLNIRLGIDKTTGLIL